MRKYLAGYMIGFGCGVWISYRLVSSKLYEYYNNLKKIDKLFHLSVRWISNIQEDKKISDYFRSSDFKKVAIYGMGYLGKILLKELRRENVEICYGVDREVMLREIDIYKPDGLLPDADVMIVTAIFDFDSIYNRMKGKVNCPIVSLDAII